MDLQLCNGLAIINVISSQVSLTTLLIISLYRLFSVVRPFKNPHFRLVVILVVLSWLFWLIVALLPIIPLETLKTGFTFGLVKNFRFDRDTLLDFAYIASNLQNEILPSFENITEVKSVLRAVATFSTPTVMEKFFTLIGWVNYSVDNWTSVGYYSLQYACSIDLLVTDEEYRQFTKFTLSFVLYNLIVAFAILITYVVVTCKVYEDDSNMCLVRCRCCTSSYSCKGLCKLSFSNNNNDVRAAENNAVFKRISIIIFTDLMCWIPLCIASLILWHSRNNAKNRHDILKGLLPLQTAMLILVSFNSILNPYIYSFHLWRNVYEKIKHAFPKKIKVNDRWST